MSKTRDVTTAPAPETAVDPSLAGGGLAAQNLLGNSFIQGRMGTGEAVGAGTGALLGGLLGGPLGAIGGGLLGGWLGSGFDGPEQAPAQAPAQAPRTGLGAYDVVPDDFVGPLGPNQIRQRDRDYLDQYQFGDFNVVGDDFVGPLQNNQMRQGDYARMQQSWLNIRDGRGMTMAGSADDQKEYLNMIRASMGDSPTMRNLMSEIGNETDPSRYVHNVLGRNQPGVFVDSYDSKEVDLADINYFPVAPDAAHPNEMTRGEQMAHYLSERRYAVTHPTDNFAAAHAQGTTTHNAYRAERGQVAETSARAEGNDAVMRYANGTEQRLHLNGNSDITGTVKP